jgi:hypothetical protein
MKSASTEAQLRRVARLEVEISSLRTAIVGEIRNEVDNLRNALREVRELAEPVGWNSVIVHDFPKLFEDFKKKQFTLLWRGTRDGFRARDFHSRCDGHSKTLTVILDTDGNIFGGFTPVEWESRKWNGKRGSENNCWKADPSLKSFLFTLKNPHNLPARRFALRAEQRDRAIYCVFNRGPSFYDIVVYANCNANTSSSTSWFGDSYTEHCGENYTNDPGVDGKTFFTGSRNFQVKEIEVFEISK